MHFSGSALNMLSASETNRLSMYHDQLSNFCLSQNDGENHSCIHMFENKYLWIIPSASSSCGLRREIVDVLDLLQHLVHRFITNTPNSCHAISSARLKLSNLSVRLFKKVGTYLDQLEIGGKLSGNPICGMSQY